MNKTAYIIITLALLVVLGIIFSGGSDSAQKQSVEIIDGIQYVRIDAGGGYSPAVTEAKAGMPTKLIVKTNGTYDCSSVLAIRSMNYQKVLPPVGEEVIDIGTPKAGDPLLGTCGMGMYSFVVNFL